MNTPTRFVLSGIPDTPGIYAFRLRATDSNGNKSERDYVIAVGKISGWDENNKLENARVGIDYNNNQLIAEGFDGPVTWSINEFGLPNGLSLNPQTGEITGIATTTGISMLSLKVTDSSGNICYSPRIYLQCDSDDCMDWCRVQMSILSSAPPVGYDLEQGPGLEIYRWSAALMTLDPIFGPIYTKSFIPCQNPAAVPCLLNPTSLFMPIPYAAYWSMAPHVWRNVFDPAVYDTSMWSPDPVSCKECEDEDPLFKNSGKYVIECPEKSCFRCEELYLHDYNSDGFNSGGFGLTFKMYNSYISPAWGYNQCRVQSSGWMDFNNNIDGKQCKCRATIRIMSIPAYGAPGNPKATITPGTLFYVDVYNHDKTVLIYHPIPPVYVGAGAPWVNDGNGIFHADFFIKKDSYVDTDVVGHLTQIRWVNVVVQIGTPQFSNGAGSAADGNLDVYCKIENIGVL